MGHFERLKKRIERGKTEDSIPMGFDRLTKHVGLYRETYYLIGGLSGTGKSSFLNDAFILNPYDWLCTNKGKTKSSIKVFYFSMERPLEYMLSRWISRKIFTDQGIILPVNKIIGRVGRDFKITSEEEEIVDHYEDYINGMTDSGFLEIFSGPTNPMGIKKIIDNYALSHGHKEKIDDYNWVYVPDNPDEIVLILYDHEGKLKRERREIEKGKYEYYSSQKEIIEVASADAMKFRDIYGYSPVKVSQFNRSISNPIRLKSGSVQPSSEDYKESSTPFEDCDCCLALFDPIRYKIAFPEGSDTLGYTLDKLRDESGAKKYKSLHILKNTYGADDIQIGLAFQPVVGLFKEMPPAKTITDEQYETIRDNSYFLI